jgi:hypothetical protein
MCPSAAKTVKPGSIKASLPATRTQPHASDAVARWNCPAVLYLRLPLFKMQHQ